MSLKRIDKNLENSIHYLFISLDNEINRIDRIFEAILYDTKKRDKIRNVLKKVIKTLKEI